MGFAYYFIHATKFEPPSLKQFRLIFNFHTGNHEFLGPARLHGLSQDLAQRDFSRNQWRKGIGFSRCTTCVNNGIEVR